MDYYNPTCRPKDPHISALKIVKYLLLCTLILLLIGLVTLVAHILLALSGAASSQSPVAEPCLFYLLTDYCAVFLITSIAFIATAKENFFFLLASALINLFLSFFNLFIPSYRWSIIFLQLCSSLFTLAYTALAYVKMKLDIRRKKRLEKTAIMRVQLASDNEMDQKSNLYQSSVHSHSYDKLVLTNEWLRTQHSSTDAMRDNQSSSQANVD